MVGGDARCATITVTRTYGRPLTGGVTEIREKQRQGIRRGGNPIFAMKFKSHLLRSCLAGRPFEMALRPTSEPEPEPEPEHQSESHSTLAPGAYDACTAYPQVYTAVTIDDMHISSHPDKSFIHHGSH